MLLFINNYEVYIKMTEIDRRGLEEEFNMDSIENDVNRLEPVNADDPEEVIKSNILRAERVLDIVENELQRGNITARMAEVTSTLINSVTQASKELMSDRSYKIYLQIKNSMVKLKEKELEWKKNKKEQPASQNLIIANREDILKIIGKEEPKKLN